MHRRTLLILPVLPLCAAAPAWALSLSETDAAGGVREALRRGAEAAVANLGRTDGFLGNKQVRIPLPGYLDDAAKLMRTFGQGKRVDELITAMNRAAEAAVPQARTLLVDTVRAISVEDALKIVRGGDTSVTDFFQRKTRTPLSAQFLPIVTRETESVSLAEKYNKVAGKAQGMGLVASDDANIQQYVTRKALDGLYWMIGEEEKKIRQDPVGTGSAILKKVFGL
ncbi:MAG: DUF4197 domain-containing protein [Rubrivivax sp.]|nr:DUF4197 domain-containing protein [Rubrivivax sp.]